MESTPTIAIIGGGPSGLVFARLLELNGITDYVVYERDQSATPGQWQQGGTLDLHPLSGQLALKRAGLFDEFSTKFARWDASCFRVLNPEGSEVFHLEGRDAPEVDRLQLRQLLLDSVPAHKVRWGNPVASVEKDAYSHPGISNTRYTVHFADGTSATGFYLIVGADGAWSKVRPLLTQARPTYSGKMFIEGIISHINPCYDSASELAGPGSMIAIGRQNMMSLQRLSDGTYRIYSGLIVPEEFYNNKTAAEDITNKSEAVRSLLLSSDDFFLNWAHHLKNFVENAEGPFRSWPLHRMDPEAVNWERSVAPGVTLLGDAAHVSTPFVGEGVNCSLYDSVVLADKIVTHCGKGASLSTCEEALETALAAYEEDMFARGRDLIERSTGSENLLFAEDADKQFMTRFLGRTTENASLAMVDSAGN